MQGQYLNLPLDNIELDLKNPRIAKYLEMYKPDQITSECIAIALGSGTEEPSGQTSYSSLYNSIKTNQGIIHPIIVNHQSDGKYVVIEGNTRVQIYKECKENKVPGSWDTIPSIVFENLSEPDIHAIRLQSHLVGPREWDPYSKAKYLNYLSNEENLPMNTLIEFCGGKASEVRKLIQTYQDMEKYYRPQLSSEDVFDQKDFSKFYEMQSIKNTLIPKYTVKDYAKWVIDGNVNSAYDVRKLPSILKNEEATKVFLKSNIKEAYEKLIATKPEYKDLKTVSIEQLSIEIINRINNIPFQEYLKIKNGESELKSYITELKDNLDLFVEQLNE